MYNDPRRENTHHVWFAIFDFQLIQKKLVIMVLLLDQVLD